MMCISFPSATCAPRIQNISDDTDIAHLWPEHPYCRNVMAVLYLIDRAYWYVPKEFEMLSVDRVVLLDLPNIMIGHEGKGFT
jgi:hypothetical protein